LDLIERLTRDRRPLGTLIHAISRAQQALHTAASHYTGPALSDPASPDQQQLAAALADTAVIATLGLHALGRNTAGELAAAADRIDPWGAATRFREADSSGCWQLIGTGPVGGAADATPAGTADDQLARYAQRRYTALATSPTYRWHYGACPAVLGAGACTCAKRDGVEREPATGVHGEPQPAQEVPPALSRPHYRLTTSRTHCRLAIVPGLLLVRPGEVDPLDACEACERSLDGMAND
jgi:hypothetical protein